MEAGHGCNIIHIHDFLSKGFSRKCEKIKNNLSAYNNKEDVDF